VQQTLSLSGAEEITEDLNVWCKAEEIREGSRNNGSQSRILWQPSPCLLDTIDLIEKDLERRNGAEYQKTAIDLACGSGRDAIFLALRGWKVVAIDYLEGHLQTIPEFALRYSVNVQTIIPSKDILAVDNTQSVSIVGWKHDLEADGLPTEGSDDRWSLLVPRSQESDGSHGGDPESNRSESQTQVEASSSLEGIPSWALLPNVRFDLVTVSRYLHRPHLPELPKLLKEGGFVCYHTFMEGCEKFGRPRNPRFLLKHGELSSLYRSLVLSDHPNQHMQIILDQFRPISDGRPTCFFLAQKTCSSSPSSSPSSPSSSSS